MTPEAEFEEIKRFLPQYLSGEAEENLFSNLSHFPDNIDERMYTRMLHKQPTFYQGDGVRGMPFINIPDPRLAPLPAMIISNTCDLSPANIRLAPLRVLYAPIFNLGKYAESLNASHRGNSSRVGGYIDAIRKQRVSNIFYLPTGSEGLDYEGYVPLDRLQNAPADILRENKIPANRLFTLGDYGFYVLLFKLSIHFSRIRENVARN